MLHQAQCRATVNTFTSCSLFVVICVPSETHLSQRHCTVTTEILLTAADVFQNNLVIELKHHLDPHLVKDCNMLEKVQRRSARFVKWDFRTTSSVTEMLHELGWKDLRDSGTLD